jgi:hypothetical protein
MAAAKYTASTNADNSMAARTIVRTAYDFLVGRSAGGTGNSVAWSGAACGVSGCSEERCTTIVDSLRAGTDGAVVPGAWVVAGLIGDVGSKRVHEASWASLPNILVKSPRGRVSGALSNSPSGIPNAVAFNFGRDPEKLLNSPGPECTVAPGAGNVSAVPFWPRPAASGS